MTEPTRPDPVPAPPRAGSGTASDDPARPDTAEETVAEAAVAEETFADLERRPVSEHVAVFEAEHARLQRELGTIDQL